MAHNTKFLTVSRVKLLGGHHVAAQRIYQRVEQKETPGDPLGHRGALELDAFTGIDLRLPIERQVVAVLRDQDMGKEPRSGEAARNRPRRCVQLHDTFTRGARKLRAHVLDHAEARRLVIDHFGHVFADLAHRPSTLGAGARGHVLDARSWQMLR